MVARVRLLLRRLSQAEGAAADAAAVRTFAVRLRGKEAAELSELLLRRAASHLLRRMPPQ